MKNIKKEVVDFLVKNEMNNLIAAWNLSEFMMFAHLVDIRGQYNRLNLILQGN